MSGACLVVVEGPDLGAEIAVPPEGGGIGREPGNVVRLSDPTVSRSHSAIELRDGAHVLIERGKGKGVRVNGVAATSHALVDGDEILVGRTRLVYLRRARRDPEATPAGRSSITHELPTAELLRCETERTSRARRHLGALARLGDGLRGAADRRRVAEIVCDALREALLATRTALLLRGPGGALEAVAGAPSGDPGAARFDLAADVVAHAMREGKAVAAEAPPGGGSARCCILGPLLGVGAAGEGEGLLYAERDADTGAAGGPWDEADLALVACAGYLASAALDGAAAREALSRENHALEERLGAPEFIGRSAAAAAVNAFTAKVGRTDSTVLVLGESGVGKELVASAIHHAGRRAHGPFVGVNCAALSETVLESELFGHEKGAFTGATERKAGRFELADGGTIFLDEVGEIPLRCQAKFLRVLEERRLERVGGARSIPVDVRVVAATNRDLEAMMRAGLFREDLYFRLSVIKIHVPPLRERAGDLPLIAQHLLGRLRVQIGRRVTGFAPDAYDRLSAYAWPGNVRELRNAIEHALVLGEGDVIRAEDLPQHVARPAVAPRPPPPPAEAAPPRTLRELERDGIVQALAATGGNKAQAAALLGIDRSTLYKKLKEYGIDP